MQYYIKSINNFMDVVKTAIIKDVNVIGITGTNFCGRSNFLQELCTASFSNDHDKHGIYLGPEIYNSLSGLGLSVQQELILHKEKNKSLDYFQKLISDFILEELISYNPFKLSGGEQVRLVLATAVLLNPKILALDCALEQVDLDIRKRLIDNFKKYLLKDSQTWIADNDIESFCSEFDLFSPLNELKPNICKIDNSRGYESLTWENNQLPTIRNNASLVLKDVSFSYDGKRNILNKLSISFDSGKIYLIDGPNGSGKTTLAKILTGLLNTDNGSIFFNTNKLNLWKTPSSICAYHYQNPDVQLFSSTVKDELLTAVNLTGGNEDRYKFIINLFKLNNFLDLHPLDFPFVLRKRIALAATLCMNRPWYIIDEPTLGQDKQTVNTLIKLIKSSANKGYGFIIISHSSIIRNEFRDNIISLI